MIVAAERSFHGRTMGSLALTGKESIRAPFGPFGLTVRFVPYGDADALRAAVGSDVAAVFLEPGLGESGVVPAPRVTCAAAREACDAAGALLVLDEIQTGIGRTGSMVRAPGRRRSARRADPGQGPGRRAADRGVRRARRGRGRLRQGRPRLHLRRQPGRLRRGPGRARHHRARRAAGPRHRGRRAPGGQPRPDQPPARRRGARRRAVAGGRADRPAGARTSRRPPGGPGSWSTRCSRTRSGWRRR